MKKILFILFTVFCFVSCYTDGTKQIDNSSAGIGGKVCVKELIYENHSYLEFKDQGIYGQGWVHNPDCKCFSDTIK